ncbi:MAG: DNA primase [Proteobacteria bacterium]|nr:DNA primase [Pseudomonadota bacterium]
MIPNDKIAEIRERADIVEIISEYVSLTRAGANFKSVCPFHADSDPSFNVNPARQFFHCFGCGVSGDVFSFLQRIEGLQFVEAARRLADRYSIELPVHQVSNAARTARERENEERARRLHILESATQFFENFLHAPNGAPGRDFLEKRHISLDAARRFRLGFAPDAWQGLIEHMAKQRISLKELIDVGLALPRKNASGGYDRFRNRLVFPILDPAGHPIAFSARAMPGDDSGAKYINSPETREYTKGKVLFGLHQARVALSKHREGIIVEGNFDVVAMSSAGFENVVAPLGTAFTADHAALLRRRVEKITVMFDGDRAGLTAAARSFLVLAKAGLAAYTAPLPPGEDPDSLLQTQGPEAVAALLKNPRGLLDEIIRSSAHASDGSAQDVARRVARLSAYLDALPTPMERDIYRQKIAASFQLDPSLVFRYLRTDTPPVPAPSAAKATEPGTLEEREIIGLMLDVPELTPTIEETGVLVYFHTEALRKIANHLLYAKHSTSSEVANIMNQDDGTPEMRWFAQRALHRIYTNQDTGQQALRDVHARMQEQRMAQQVAEIDRQINRAKQQRDDMMVFSLLKKRAEIQKEMQEIRLAFDKTHFKH